MSASVILLLALLPLQLPLTVSRHTLLIARRACVFLQNSWTVGFLLALPRCLCRPKYFSKGSWETRSLKKHLTPGKVKIYLTKSMNDFTIERNIVHIKQLKFCSYNTAIPVNRSPSLVSALSIILFHSAMLSPLRPWTLASQPSR